MYAKVYRKGKVKQYLYKMREDKRLSKQLRESNNAHNLQIIQAPLFH